MPPSGRARVARMRMVVVLPALVRAEEPEHLAAPDREVDPVQRPGLAVDLDQAARLDRRAVPGHPVL